MELMDGCGGRRSRNRAEQERDGGMDGCCLELHEVVSAQMEEVTQTVEYSKPYLRAVGWSARILY
jgi:hypothetical protein